MRRMGLGLLSMVSIAACASKEPAPKVVEAPVTPVASVAPPAPLPPPDLPRADRFPGGPGVSLTKDQLVGVQLQVAVTNQGIPYADWLRLAKNALGEDGRPYHDELGDAQRWFGVGPRGGSGPWSCYELVVYETAKAAPFVIRGADNAMCGLPYLEDHTQSFKGEGARRTVTPMREVIAEYGGKGGPDVVRTAKLKLSGFDADENGTFVWNGIGPRGKDAPITCWTLRIGPQTAELAESPLETCNLAWGPPPKERFDSGPAVPPMDLKATVAACEAKCGPNEICMVDKRTPFLAQTHTEADGTRARFSDGYPARGELVSSCVPVPAGCSPVVSSCFFKGGLPNKPDPAPCPKEGSQGHSVLGTPPHIECFTRIGGPPPKN